MFELRTLGLLDVRSPDGRALQSVLAQPKRAALLVYLAVAAPRGFHRRDTLFPLFWPESDAERGRNSLRQALYFLRRSLSNGAVVSRGDDEVAIPAAAVWCDAVAFEDALDEGRFGEALALYRGDFLAGHHFPDAPELERWVERERQRLRGRARDALRALAEAEEQAGRWEGAVAHHRRALELDPHDSRAVLGMMQALAEAGDRVEAVRQAELHTALLRDELGLRGDPEVLAFAARLRGEPGAGVEPRSVDPGPPAGEGRAAPQPAPSSLPRRGRGRATSLRAAMVAGLILLAVAGVGGAIMAGGRDAERPRSAAEVRNRVAVLPFSIRSTRDLGYLGEGMVDLLSTKLDGAGELSTADPRLVLAAVSAAEGGKVTPEQGRALARELNAGTYVLGNILEVGGRLLLSASVYDRAGRQRSHAEVVAPDEARLFEAVDRLAAQLAVGLTRSTAPELSRLARLTTASLPALKAYLRGEAAFRQQRYSAAVEAFQRALAVDSTFGLAAYRLSIAADWAGEYDMAAEAVERAYRFRGELPEMERLLVEALLAFNNDAPADAKRLYRAVLARRPESVEAWYRLAETEYHYNPLLGLSPEESRRTFERVLQLDPDHQPARTHLALLASWRGDLPAFDSLTAPLMERSPDEALSWRHLRAFVRHDPAAQRRVALARRTASDADLWALARDAVLYAQSFGDARHVARDLVGASRDPELRVGGHLLGAWIEMIRGRPRAAERQLAAAATLNPAAALEYRAVFAIPHFVPVPPEALRAIRDSLDAWEGTVAENPYLPLYTDMRSTRRDFLAGLLSARLGDVADARRRIAALAPAADDPPGRARSLAARVAVIRAHLAARGGDPRTALALVGRPLPEGTPPPPFPALNFSGRHLRPDLYLALGEPAEALRWYGATPFRGNAYAEETLMDLVYLAPSHLQRARILERTGKPDEAAAHYRRFISLWEDAEPELRPLVAEARRRLARL